MSARILCIEDEPGLGEDVVLELEDAGYAVDLATDGAQAIAAMAGRTYDLVLCDVQVPVRGGLDILAEVAGDPARAAPPFIMLTAYCDPALHARCARAGARHLLVKPVDYEALLALVARELAR